MQVKDFIKLLQTFPEDLEIREVPDRDADRPEYANVKYDIWLAKVESLKISDKELIIWTSD